MFRACQAWPQRPRVVVVGVSECGRAEGRFRGLRPLLISFISYAMTDFATLFHHGALLSLAHCSLYSGSDPIPCAS